jgi:hypothetical protein
MPGNLQTTPAGVQDVQSVRAQVTISPNLRVETASGFVGTIADVLQFNTPLSVTGMWTVPEARLLVCGVPAIAATGVGVTLNPVTGSIGPMIVVQPDGAVRTG